MECLESVEAAGLIRFRTGALRDASPWREDSARLRSFAEKQGYLYFRNLLPREPIERLRDRVLDACVQVGWLESPSQGPPNPGIEIGAYDDPKWVEMQVLVQGLSEFHGLGAQPRLLSIVGELGGGKAARTHANTCRAFSAESAHLATLPHQDGFYVRKPARFWTAWIPLGDCPRALGPLAVLPGSHRGGLRPHRGAGAGRQGTDVELDRVWSTRDFLCGDVLLFDRLTVHRACPNRVPDRLRLSVDYRYALGEED